MVISKILNFFTCLVFIIYFAGESVHSLWNELGFNSDYSTLFYWINKGLFSFLITFLFSFYIINIQTKLIVRGGSFFLLGLALFQCLHILHYISNPLIWILICPAFIILVLIISKTCQQRIT